MTYDPTQAITIGYDREDGDFRVLATLSNVDDEFTQERFVALIESTLASMYQHLIAINIHDLPTLRAINRQDAPDYVTIDEEA